MNLIPNIDVAVDINSLAPVFIDHILNVNDTNSRTFSVTLYANNRKISLYSGNFTAKAAIAVNNILLDDNVTALIQTDSTVAVTVDNKYLTLIPGVMKIQLTITGGTDVIVTPQPILARVTSDLAQTAQILPDSHSSYSEIVAEIVAARGDYDNLAQALSHLMGFLSSEPVNNATDTGKVYYTTPDKALIIPVSAEFSQVQFRLARDGKIYARRRSRSSTSADFPAWGAFDQIGWKRSDIEGWIEAAIESLEPEYIFVAEIPSNADHSKKYVLPDGYIWEWQEGTPGTTYNAANLANINKTAVTGSSSTTLAAKNGVITSDLIPWDSSWTVAEPPGNNSTIAISGVSALVPVQYNSYGGALFVYYYRSDGSYIEARRPATLQNVEYSDEQSIPISAGQSYSFQLADSELYNLSNIGYIRIVLGISTSAITTQDVANLVINIPAYDVPATSGDWVNTGVKHPDYGHGLPDGGTAGQVLTKTVNGEAWQDIDFSNALNVQSGQKLYAVGDSITYGHGIGGNNYSWVKHVIDHNGYEPYGANGSKNLGLSGLGFCTNAPGNPPRSLENIIGAEGFFSGADIVTVALGINDWKNTSATLSAFWSGMEYCFDKIRTDNPYCKVFYILPFNASYMGDLSSYYCLGTRGDSDTSKPYGHTLQDFINMIKAKFEEPTFKAFNVNVIDLTECPELNRRNITTALYDGLHPSAATNVKLGQDIARRMILS